MDFDKEAHNFWDDCRVNERYEPGTSAANGRTVFQMAKEEFKRIYDAGVLAGSSVVSKKLKQLIKKAESLGINREEIADALFEE